MTEDKIVPPICNGQCSPTSVTSSVRYTLLMEDLGGVAIRRKVDGRTVIRHYAVVDGISKEEIGKVAFYREIPHDDLPGDKYERTTELTLPVEVCNSPSMTDLVVYVLAMKDFEKHSVPGDDLDDLVSGTLVDKLRKMGN